MARDGFAQHERAGQQRPYAPSLRETVPVRLCGPGRDVVRTTTGVQLRGPERSEGHVSCNIRVMLRPPFSPVRILVVKCCRRWRQLPAPRPVSLSRVFLRPKERQIASPASRRQVRLISANTHDNVRCHSGSGVGGPQLNHEWNAARLSEKSPPSTSAAIADHHARRFTTDGLLTCDGPTEMACLNSDEQDG